MIEFLGEGLTYDKYAGRRLWSRLQPRSYPVHISITCFVFITNLKLINKHSLLSFYSFKINVAPSPVIAHISVSELSGPRDVPPAAGLRRGQPRGRLPGAGQVPGLLGERQRRLGNTPSQQQQNIAAQLYRRLSEALPWVLCSVYTRHLNPMSP